MCGIIAVAERLGRKSQFGGDCERLLTNISHRGPDHAGLVYAFGGNVFIGHSLLCTTSLSVADSAQPWTDCDHTIAFNGEIYNHGVIRKELEALGEMFTTETDTEVLVKGYRQLGIRILEKIEGCWAFVILDKQRGVLHFGRDPLGEKQLCFGTHQDRIAVGSEAKSVLEALNLGARINESRIYTDLIFDFFSDREHTYFQSISNCTPGYVYSVQLRDLMQIRTKSSNHQVDFSTTSSLETLFLSSVHQMMPRVFEACVMLSGGFDSSTIAAGLRKLFPDKRFAAFTVRYGQERSQDYIHAKRVIEEIGNFELQEVKVDKDLYAQLHDEIALKLEEPVYDHVFLAQYLLYKAAHERGYRIAYSGQGSDEFWGGYTEHYAIRELYANPSLESHFAHFKTIALRRGVQLLLDDREIKDLIETGLHSKWNSHGPLGKILIEGHLQAMLSHEDRMSMASSVAVRLPFLNRKFLSHSFAAPPEESVTFGIEKYRLRVGLSELAPPSAAMRKKQAFPDAPSSHYDYLENAIEFYSDSSGDGYFFGATTLKLLKKHCRESFKKALCVNQFERVFCR